MSDPMTVAVLWAQFGPYHLARLEAAARVGRASDGRIVGVEVCGTDRAYPWHDDGRACRFERTTLCPGGEYTALPRRTIAARVTAGLDEVRPSAVAINGWRFTEARAALRWCMRRRVPAILMSDSTADSQRRHAWKEAIKRQVVRRFDAALAAGTPQADYVAQLGMTPSRIFLGYDAVDNAYFADRVAAARAGHLQARPHGLPRMPYWLTVARFVPHKNLPRAMDAYACYRQAVGSDAAWPWVLCGDGPLRDDVLAVRSRLGLERDVILPGFVQYESLPSYYAHAAAFWLPSQLETWGLAVNEAMASGLPVLVSRHAGCATDLVDEARNGWTFDPTDAGAMTAALVRMHRQSDARRLAMRRRSEAIIANWGLDRFARGLWDAVRVGWQRRLGRRPARVRATRLRVGAHEEAAAR